MTEDHRLMISRPFFLDRKLRASLTKDKWRLKYTIIDDVVRKIRIDERPISLLNLGNNTLWNWFVYEKKSDAWIQYDNQNIEIHSNMSYKIPPLLHVQFKLMGYTILSQQPLLVNIKKLMIDSVENQLKIGDWSQRINGNYQSPNLPGVLSTSFSSIDQTNKQNQKSTMTIYGC